MRRTAEDFDPQVGYRLQPTDLVSMTSALPFDHRRFAPQMWWAMVGFASFTLINWHRRRPDVFDSSLTARLVARPSTAPFLVAEVFSSVGSVGSVVVIALVTAVGVSRYRSDFSASIPILLAAGVGGLSEFVLAGIIARPRPLTAGLTGESGFGFPSGHTTVFSAVAVALVLTLGTTELKGTIRSNSVVAAVASCAVAVSRVVVGAHYLFDVIGGLALGITIGIGAHLSISSIRSHVSRR